MPRPEGLYGLRISISKGWQGRVVAPGSPCLGNGLTERQPVQPRQRTRLEAQAPRRAGHGAGGAAQDAQALLVDVMKRRAGKEMRNRCHAGIVKAGGDAGVSVRWQLYDSAQGLSGPNTDGWRAPCC